MIELVAFVARHRTLGRDEFHHRWRDDHGARIAANPAAREHLVRYEHNRRKPRDYERAGTPYDGVAVQWYDSWNGFRAMLADPRYAPITADEQSLFDSATMLVVFTEPEHVVIEGPSPRPSGLTKLFCAIRRRPGNTVEEFRRHWRAVHGPLNRDTPAIARHILRYEQHPARPDNAFDGVTVQWFESAREFFAMAAEPEQRDVIEPDEKQLLDRESLVWILTGAEETILG